MKLLSGLLIWVSLAFGVVAAAAIYFPDITNATPEEFLTTNEEGESIPITIKAPVGPAIVKDGSLTPAFPTDTPLNATNLDAMRDAGVTRVKILELNRDSWRRWTHKWQFIASLVGLIAGAFLAKFAARKDLEAAVSAPEQESPEFALAAARDETAAVFEMLPSLPTDKDRLNVIISRLGELQQTHLTAYPAARDRIIAKHGLGGYAQRMDAFAAADRRVNRAWSAAADGNLDEATESLAEAVEVFGSLTT
ncbi:MAG: hypothetical protein AAGI53_04790 [Planctomycetota bacterium]